MHRSQLAYVLLLLLALPRWAVAIEPEWGHLSGRFVYDGEPPPALALEIPAHYQSRVKGKDIPDESLLVGKDGGLANVFIWLRPALGVKLPIHPSYDEPPVETLELVAQEFRLQPRAFFVRVGQKFNVHHADRRVSYNLKFDFFNNPPFVNLVPQGSSVPITITKGERVPVAISCNIHPWMHSRILVLDHPYAAVTDQEGRFEIRNLPVGKWDFVAVHERTYIKQPTIDGRQLEWKRGTFEYLIRPGDNTLGDVKIDPAELQPKSND